MTMSRSILLLFGAFLAALLLKCSSNEVAGTTNVGNAQIEVAMTGAGENGAEGVNLSLREIIITREGDSLIAEKKGITGPSGYYVFESLPAGKYVLYSLDAASGKSSIESNIDLKADAVYQAGMRMRPSVTLQGRILSGPGVDPSRILVFIPGTDIQSGINSNQAYSLSGAPVGRYDIGMVFEDIVNYLPVEVAENAEGTVFFRDVRLALLEENAVDRYSFFDFTLDDAFSVRPMIYATQEIPAWYHARDFHQVTYFKTLGGNLSVIIDTVKVFDTVTVYDTLAVYDTMTVFDTVVFLDSIAVFDTLFFFDTAFVYDSVVQVDTIDVKPGLFLGKFSAIQLSEGGSGAANLVYDTVTIYDTVRVNDTVRVYDTVRVHDTVAVYDSISVNDTSEVSDTLVQVIDTIRIGTDGTPLLLVDDFELDDGHRTSLKNKTDDSFWYVFVENATTVIPGSAMAGISAAREDGIMGKALHLRFDIDPASDYPPSGFGFAPAGNRYADFSKMTGFSFLAKGTGSILVIFNSETVYGYPAVQNERHFRAEVALPAEWTRIAIRPGDIRPEAGSPQEADSLTWDDVKGAVDRVNFLMDSGAGQTVEIWIDDIHFEGLTYEDL